MDSIAENNLKIDLEIRRLLLENNDVTITADQLLKRTESSVFTFDELKPIARFLINANLKLTLFNFLTQQASHDFDDLDAFPWSFWFECISIFSTEEQKELYVSFKNAITPIENSNPDLYSQLNYELEQFNPEKNENSLSDSKSRYLESLKNAALEKIEDLKTQFFWLQSQELYSQAAETLKQLAMLTSLSNEMLPDLKKWTSQLNEKRAAELLNKKTRDLKKQGHIKLLQTKDKEEINFLKTMATEVTTLARTHPEMVSDFSILLTTLENYSAAVDLLPNSNSLVWLKIEIMIHAKKNLEVLGLLLDLEKSLPETTENILAIGYTRALALKQLGKTKEAIAIMENIYHRYPDYRSASQLFREWNGDLYD